MAQHNGMHATLRPTQQCGKQTRACLRLQVWEHAGSGTIRWDATELGQDIMGVVAENWRLQAALLRSALNAPGSQVSGGGGAATAPLLQHRTAPH
jgi:hypothetical protein